ncbi:hypothetical protein [Methanoregula sp.]|uniref:hypothetical protein n=1 Tax=Methanoregula sp. TaxID=2052170 RepID=UPI003BAF2774
MYPRDHGVSGFDRFREINEDMHQTIVTVSHEDWHKDYFHRIVQLRDGKVISDETGRTDTGYSA